MRTTDIKELINDKLLYELDAETRGKYEGFLKNLDFSSEKDYQEFLEVAKVIDLDNYSVSYCMNV
jgi:hypothetical protein